MATQFISSFIVIGLIVFLGVVTAIGIMNSKADQARLSSRPPDHEVDAKD